MSAELNRQQWREGLYQSFAKEGISKENCAELANRFDQLTEMGKMSGETAASVIYSAFGANDAKKVCKSISDWINSELTEFNASHPGVSRDPLVRLRAWVKRFNSAVDSIKCAVEIEGRPALSESELAKVKVRLPGALNLPITYSAKASNLEMDVTI